MSVNIGPIVGTQLTRSINVGQVTIPGNTATLIIAANPNREKIFLNGSLDQGGLLYVGTNNAVSNTTGYLLPYFTVSQWGTNGRVMEFLPQGTMLDWNTDIWGYSTVDLVITYAEEILS